MAVRPFYIESDIEGRQTMLKGGPKSGSGDMNTTIYVRDEGCITTPIEVRQYHDLSGDEHKLVTDVVYNGDRVVHHVTKY